MGDSLDFSAAMQAKLRQAFPNWGLDTDYVLLVESSVSLRLPVMFAGKPFIHESSLSRRQFLVNVFSGNEDFWLNIVKGLAESVAGQTKDSNSPDIQGVLPLPSSIKITRPTAGFPSSHSSNTIGNKGVTQTPSVLEAAGIEFEIPLNAQSLDAWRKTYLKTRTDLVKATADEKEKRKKLDESLSELQQIKLLVEDVNSTNGQLLYDQEKTLGDFTDETLLDEAQDVILGLEMYLLSSLGLSRNQILETLEAVNLFSESLGFKNKIECVMGLRSVANDPRFGLRRASRVIAAMRIYSSVLDDLDAEHGNWLELYFLQLEKLKDISASPSSQNSFPEKLLSKFKLKNSTPLDVGIHQPIDQAKLSVAKVLLTTVLETSEIAQLWLELIANSKLEANRVVAESKAKFEKYKAELSRIRETLNAHELEIGRLQLAETRNNTNLEKARTKKLAISTTLEELEQVRLTSIQPGTTLVDLRELEDFYKSTIFSNSNLGVKSCSICIWEDFDFYTELVSILLCLDSQNRDKSLASCPLCNGLITICQCGDVNTRMAQYVERWHKIEFSKALDLLEDYGSWTWGFFHIEPLKRIQNLMEFFKEELWYFDTLILRLRLAPLVKYACGPDENDTSLPEFIPKGWDGMSSLRGETFVGEMDEALLTKLIDASSRKPSPAQFVQENWHDYAAKFEKLKYERAIKEATEIPSTFNYDD